MTKDNTTSLKQIEEFKAFCKMDHETLERHLIDGIPIPPKDKPFVDESQNSKTNPFLVEMMESTRCLGLLEIIIRSRNLFLIFLAASVAWLLGSNVWVWIILGIAVVVDQWWLIKFEMEAWRTKFMDNYWYVTRLSYHYVDPAIGYQTYWNMERLKKWAVARYDFTSTETFMAIMGKEGEMVETGPMAGRFVTTSTGEEWPLRPAQVEAV